jgi:GxxExxY protein
MIEEMQRVGLQCDKQRPIKVYYKSTEVGIYFADIVVEDKVILEIKAAGGIIDEHEAQLLNYLKATEIEPGLLLNFGKEPQFRRKIFSNSNKNNPLLSA